MNVFSQNSIEQFDYDDENNSNNNNNNIAVPTDHREKIKENRKRYKCLDLAREVKIAMEHEGDGDILIGAR